MKCPECIKEGKKSRVYYLRGSMTCMYSPPYYDEEGIYHNHDPNWHYSEYKCSNDHEWGTSTRSSCPTCGEWWVKLSEGGE